MDSPTPFFRDDFFVWAKTIFPEARLSSDAILFGEKLKVHLLAVEHGARFQKKAIGKNEIVLWEDVWHNRKEQVKARIASLLGQNTTIWARDTQVRKLEKPVLDAFLEANHLMDVVSAKFKYGLYYKGILVAAACFSAPKTFYREEGVFRSTELVRYASLQGVNVVGGLGKLLEHCIEQQRPDDIMTYTDREWSDGEVYEKLGFEKVEETEPMTFWVHPIELKRYPAHRLRAMVLDVASEHDLENQLRNKGYFNIQNLGNNKFLKRLK